LLACLPFAAALSSPTQTAEYTVTFDATWSAQTHPSNFPPGPHFSGLIGSTHDSSVSFWQVCQVASPGIENMAETGSKSPLITEIATARMAGTADSLISGGGINPSPGSVSVSFEIDLDFPLVTLVSMIAPSPDWFVGVSALSLLEGGDWVQEKVVPLLPYDAGTDSGSNYTSANQDTDPQELIMLITALPAGNGVPLGTFRFTRTDVPTTAHDAAVAARLPGRTQLFENAPNPFNPSTTLRFDLARADHVSLRVFDVKGRLVRTLVNQHLPRDRHEFVWDGMDDAGGPAASGTYFYRLYASGFVQTRKMIIAK
jgi:hypothetical protein